MASDSTTRNSGSRSGCQPLSSAIPTEDFNTVDNGEATHRTLKYDFNDYFGGRADAQPIGNANGNTLWNVCKEALTLVGCLAYIAHTVVLDRVSAYYQSSSGDIKKKE
ncbi:hypothetical protein AAVH_01460 [Aphelenchoides avenae]|nr:hypothetical protein AAVH_01460 [Aphelenchus avenae]